MGRWVEGVRAYACSKGEFQVIRAKSVVVDRNINNFFQKLWFAKKVFCNPEPEAEELPGFLCFSNIAEFRSLRA